MINDICPKTKIPLKKDSKGHLHSLNGDILYRAHNGCIDFVSSSQNECQYYDERYSRIPNAPSFSNLEQYWNGKYIRSHKILFERLPDLKEKIVLLLGNGQSEKEFIFLKLGAYLIYSDLSLTAVSFMKNAFEHSTIFNKYKDRIEFHAIEAMSLPFPEESLDVVYACSLVHHIRDLPRFFSEVHRVLKYKGFGIFHDGAYSPIWQSLKNTVLKPLQKISHKKHGISPEDLRATKEGGYRKHELAKLLSENGFELSTFCRVSFFSSLWARGINKLIGNREIARRGMLIFNVIDDFLAKISQLFRDNQIKLIWAVRKI